MNNRALLNLSTGLKKRLSAIALSLGLVFCFFPNTLHAQIIDPAMFGIEIPTDVANAAIQTVGALSMHRPYTGATSLGKINSLDLLIEATLVKIGDTLPKALEANNLDASTAREIPSLPFGALHLRKGMGQKMDIGLSALYFQKNLVWGIDAKFVVIDPEEGLTHAILIGHTNANLPMVYTSLASWNIEWITSRKLSFAEPYIALGGRYSTGTLKLEVIPDPPLPQDPISLSMDGRGMSAYARTGVFFRVIGPQGLRIGLEGSFDIRYMHTLGLVLGLGF